MSGVQPSYPVGGVIDRVKKLPPLEIFKMPGQPSKTIPYAKGFRLELPAAKVTKEVTFTVPSDMELVSVAIACSGYADLDYWELGWNGEKLFEVMYTKEVPEAHAMGAGAGVLPVSAGDKLTMAFVNDSETSKVVWFNLRFLRDPITATQA